MNKPNDYIQSELHKVILNEEISMAKGEGLSFESTSRMVILNDVKDSLDNLNNKKDYLKHNIEICLENIDILENPYDVEQNEITIEIMTHMLGWFKTPYSRNSEITTVIKTCKQRTIQINFKTPKRDIRPFKIF